MTEKDKNEWNIWVREWLFQSQGRIPLERPCFWHFFKVNIAKFKKVSEVPCSQCIRGLEALLFQKACVRTCTVGKPSWPHVSVAGSLLSATCSWVVQQKHLLPQRVRIQASMTASIRPAEASLFRKPNPFTLQLNLTSDLPVERGWDKRRFSLQGHKVSSYFGEFQFCLEGGDSTVSFVDVINRSADGLRAPLPAVAVLFSQFSTIQSCEVSSHLPKFRMRLMEMLHTRLLFSFKN